MKTAEYVSKCDEYLRGSITLDQLFRWLASRVQQVAESYPALQEFDAQVWLQIDDVDDGAQPESAFRIWLRQQLANA